MLLVLDIFMPKWYPKISKLGGLPNHAHEPRKMVSLGKLIKNESE